MMTYSLPCECGRVLAVASHNAGADILCDCGRQVRVPLLSQLRRNAGHGAYESGTINTIQRMVHANELPAGSVCVISGIPTEDSYNLYVQCESKWMKGPGVGRYWFVALSILFLPFWIIWVLVGSALLNEERRELGNDRSVRVPLRVHKAYHHKLRGASNQRWLKKLLRKVPIYAKLLEEFPAAKVYG